MTPRGRTNTRAGLLPRNTHYACDYDRNPSAAYAEDAVLIFPVRFRMHGKDPKTPVLGVGIGEQASADPFPAFADRPLMADHCHCR